MDMTRAEWHWYVTARGIACRAGEAALETFGYADHAEGAGWDRGLARKAAEAMDPANPASVDLWMERFYRVALALCRDHRAALERLADTLEANDDYLTGDEVPRSLDAALAGTGPTPIFTGRRHISQAVFVDRLGVRTREMEAAAGKRTV